MKRNTAVQYAGRAGVPLSRFIWQRIDALGNEVQLPRLVDQFTLVPPKPPALGNIQASGFTVGKCIQVLAALAGGQSLDLVQKGNLLSNDQCRTLDWASIRVVSEVYAARRKVCPAKVVDVSTAAADLGIDFGRVRQPRYEELVASLALPVELELGRRASRAWCSSWWKTGYLSADPPSRILPILQLLRFLGTPSTALEIRVEKTEGAIDRYTALTSGAHRVFASVFGDPATIRDVEFAAKRRPRAYLIWPASEAGHAAESSNAGLDAVLFATAVWSQPLVQEWGCREVT